MSCGRFLRNITRPKFITGFMKIVSFLFFSLRQHSTSVYLVMWPPSTFSSSLVNCKCLSCTEAWYQSTCLWNLFVVITNLLVTKCWVGHWQSLIPLKERCPPPNVSTRKDNWKKPSWKHEKNKTKTKQVAAEDITFRSEEFMVLIFQLMVNIINRTRV